MLIKSLNLNVLSRSVCLVSIRGITVRKWRRQRGMGERQRQSSVVTDGPDWSYTDGRGFGPMTVGQKNRYLRDQQMAQTISQYMKQFRHQHHTPDNS